MLEHAPSTSVCRISPEFSVIQLEPKLFDGALSYNSTGDLAREHAPYERIWVGDPGPEMDRLWDHVEAVAYSIDSTLPRRRGRPCAGSYNAWERIKYEKPFIRNTILPPRAVEHTSFIGAVMCNADTTLVTHKWFESAQTFGPNFRTQHTCRNFDALMDWSLARSPNVRAQQGPGSEAVEDETMVMWGERLEKTKAALGVSGHGHHSP
ncbi:hypothetical protein TruAng_007366 [Truncatella angustata]|nr:hypothetical protein TruAng_007366 [Truncatella angustata]